MLVCLFCVCLKCKDIPVESSEHRVGIKGVITMDKPVQFKSTLKDGSPVSGKSCPPLPQKHCVNHQSCLAVFWPRYRHCRWPFLRNNHWASSKKHYILILDTTVTTTAHFLFWIYFQFIISKFLDLLMTLFWLKEPAQCTFPPLPSSPLSNYSNNCNLVIQHTSTCKYMKLQSDSLSR